MALRRFFIYLAGFVLPPIMYGLVLTFTTISKVMIHAAPEALPSPLPVTTRSPSMKPRAVFLLSGVGTQILDFLGPAEVLGESRLFDLVTVSPAENLAPTTTDLSIVPDFHFGDFKPAKNDILVVPAVVDPAESKLIEWLRTYGPQFKFVLVAGEGARLALSAGLLSGHTATSHFIARHDLVQEAGTATTIKWVWGPRYVVSGNLITSAGIVASVDAALALVELAGSPEQARQISKNLGYDANNTESYPSLDPSDFLNIFLHAGYDWNKKAVAVLVYDGASELGLGAGLDFFTRTYSAFTQSTGADRKAFVTRHGLHVVPGTAIAQLAPVDLLIVPSGLRQGSAESGGALPPANDPLKDAAVHRWVEERSVPVKSQLFDAPGKSIEQDFSLIQQTIGPRIAQFAGKLAVFSPKPSAHAPSGGLLDTEDDTLLLWMKPLIIGILGMFVAWLFDRKLHPKR